MPFLNYENNVLFLTDIVMADFPQQDFQRQIC